MNSSVQPATPASQQGHVFRRMCQQGNIELIDQMLRAGMPIETAQDDGCTGLWLASEAGNADAVRFLCGRKANVNCTKTAGNVSALYIAAQNGHLAVVDVLLLNGANPNIAKHTGTTAVFIASQQGFSDILRALLKAGANYNTPNNQGITPLMISAYQGHIGCVSQLLGAGADPYTTGQGKNTLEWAQANGHRGAVQQCVESHLRDVESQLQRRNDGASSYNAAGTTAQAAPTGNAPGQPGGPVPATPRGATTFMGKSGLESYLPQDGLQTNGWYTPQFLTKSPRAGGGTLNSVDSRFVDTRSFEYRPDQMSVGGGGSMARSANQHNGLSTELGSGFSGGGLTPMAIAEEERRQRDFHRVLQRERAKEGAPSSPGAEDGPFTVQKAYAVEQEWDIHKARLKNASRELADTAADVQDSWMFSVQATAQYSNQMDKVRREMIKAERQNKEQDQQSAANLQSKGFAFPSLPVQKVETLNKFMMRGQGAKGPPPPLPPEEEENVPPEQDPYAVQDAIVLPSSTSSTYGASTTTAPPAAAPAAASVEDADGGKKMTALQKRLAARAKKKAGA